NYAEWRRKPPALVPGFADVNKGAAKTVIARAIQSRGSGWLSAEECRAVLSAFKIPQAAGGLARTSLQAVEMARTVGYPVAAKLASPRVLHKSDIGAVRLNLENEYTVRQAFEAIQREGLGGMWIRKRMGWTMWRER